MLASLVTPLAFRAAVLSRAGAVQRYIITVFQPPVWSVLFASFGNVLFASFEADP